MGGLTRTSVQFPTLQLFLHFTLHAGLLPSKNDFTPSDVLPRVSGFPDGFREPAQASNLGIRDPFTCPQACRDIAQYRKTGRKMAPICLCGAALP